MRLTALTLSLLLAACGHKPPTIPSYIDSNVPDSRKVSIDKSLLKQCKPIPQLKGNTEPEIITWISEWKLIYVECKSSKDALINSITSAFPDSK